jgi:hypothetical protein
MMPGHAQSASTYTFNRHAIKHRFCGVDPDGNAMAAINIRCLEGIELEAIPVIRFDGRAL